MPEDQRLVYKFKREFSESLAGATLTAIAGVVIVHGAILTGFRTTRLVCGEANRTNQRRKDRKQKLKMTFHRLNVGHECDERQRKSY